MNFDFTSEDRALQGAAREAAGRNYPVKPDDPENLHLAVKTLLKDLAPTGYLDLGLTDAPAAVNLTAAMEAVAGTQPVLFPIAETSPRVFGRLIRHYAGEALRNEILPRVREGDILGAVAFFDARMDQKGSETPIVGAAEGGRVRVSGKKNHVLGAAADAWLAVTGTLGE